MTIAAATLSITKTHSGNFTQGQSGSWTIDVNVNGNGNTSGAVTVTDTLPAGYSLVSGAGTHWSCSGTTAVTCTNADTVQAHASFPALTLTVNVPADSPKSIQNSATASGGGATNSPVISAADTVAVNQVAATMVTTSGGGQSAMVNTAFANPLVVTVKDAGGIAVPNATVTFTVLPNNGAGATFAGGVNTAKTSASGVAMSPVLTANSTAGTYTVSAAAGAATGTFSLTNTAPALPVLTVGKSHNGNFTQGQTGAWTINVANAGTGATSGAMTVTDTLPAGYTLSSGTGTHWSCSGNSTVTCTNSDVVAAGSSFPAVTLNVNVPANSPVTVQNSAAAAGGGAANPITSSLDTVTVTQVAATIAATSGTPQSAQINTAFANPLVATVKDAGGIGVPNATVTFTVVPVAGAGGTFAGGVTTATTNASGVATSQVFTANGTAGTYSVTAASGAATGATFSLTNTAGTPSKLAFTTQPPANGTAGTAFSAVVQVQDSKGTLVSNSTASVTISSTPSGVSGTTTVNAVNGVATFNNLTINTANGYTLTATATNLTPATSTSITIGAAAASQVVFTTPPSNGTAGQALTPAVVVKIEDQFNNVVNSSARVTVSSTPSGVTGTQQVNAVSGVATFNNLVFNASNSYTLTAASGSLTSATSGSFTISAGSGSKLVFSTQPPSNATAGAAFNAVVQVKDANGNLVTGSNAQVEISSSPAGLSGATTATAVNGVATFSNLVLNKADAYTLTATSSGLTNATSTSITIGAAAAMQVVFTTAPNSGTAGQVLTPAVVAQIEDQFNNVVANSSVPVTVSSTPPGVNGMLQVNAVNGVATFNNLVFNAANNYTLMAGSPGLTSATSASFTISAGSGNKLVFTMQPPANGTAGQALTPAVAVQVQDANGNLVTNSKAAISIGSTPSNVGGTLTMNASGGIAIFSNLVFTATGSYTLTATSTGLSNATSTSIAIGPGAANKLAFSVQPSSGTAGQALSPAVAVQVQDANGNVVTGSSAAVTISSTPAGVGGTLTVNASDGVATFSGLSFTATGNYTLTAASTSLASINSTSFTISAGSGNKLAISVQPPASGTAGQALRPGLVVQVQDANGNLVTNSTVAVSIGSTPAGVSGTLTVNAASGVATFNNLAFNTAGSYTLTATSTGLSNATSTSVAIGPGAATKLAIAVQPSSGTAGQALTPAVVVDIQDDHGNLVTSSTASVSIASTPAGLGGTATATAVNGVATFDNVTFNTAGNYTLTATSAGLTSINSNSFTISPGSGNKLVFTTQPSASGTAGQPLPPVVVQIQDANGNLVTGSTAQVSIASNVAAVGGTLTVSAIGGIATFDNLVFTKTGSYTLTATSTGLANASSTPLAIAPGAPNKMAFTVQPSSGTATQPLNPAVVVQISDANDNVVTSFTAAVTIASAPPGVDGTLTVNASGGIATFSNLSFTTANNYTLSAAAGSLPSVVSHVFTISAGAPGGVSMFTGSGQITQVARNFGNPLVVLLRDSVGNPVPNVTVTFTAPATGASGTFNGSSVATAVTGANGQATSPSFTANNIPGTYNVIASAAGVATTATFSMTNVAALAIVTATLSNATQAAQYNQQLVATGGIPPYVWSLSGGNLPAGVSLFPSGMLTGAPTAAGTFSFTTRVRDSVGATADQSMSLAVAGPLAISTCPASTGIVNVPYNSTAVATGGQTPYIWSFTSGAFPPGLTLNALTGAVTGAPTSSGTFTVTLVVTDKNAATAQLGCGFTIAPALSITTQTVADASQSSPYSQSLVATGGKAPYTWSVSGALPSGLTLNATTGTLSGTPTQTANQVSFTVSVTDSASITVQRTYTMSVFAGLIVGACPQGIAEVGFPYNSTLVGEGGSLPYNWSVSGSLPAGLQFNSAAGTISGTPTQVGPAALIFTVTDKSTRTNSKPCPLNVQPPVAIPTASLSGGSTGASYADGVTAAGGVSPYVFSTTGGSLPPGLTIDGGTGKIAGRPIASGTFAFTVQVTDNLGAQTTKDLSINVAQGLTIPNCPAPVGNIGQAYSSPLVAQGGTTPYVWSIGSGALPPGLTLQSADSLSVITGTPSQSGTSAFVLQAVDAANSNVTRACSIQINGAPLTITTSSLPNGLLGVAYSQTLTAAGGTAPYIWSMVGPGAPPAFSIDSTGVLSGVPSDVGTYTFTIQVMDQDNNVAQQSVTVTILAGTAPNVTIGGLTDIVDPATQPAFSIQLDGAYPAPIDGTVTLTFTPDPTIGIDDPKIVFATGTRTLRFTVAANSTTPVFTVPVALASTGTVAGSIQLDVKLSSGGADITPSGTAVRSVRVDRLAPKIVSMTATQTSSGIQVQIVGYSTTREVTQGTFQFSVSGGGAPLSATVQLTDSAKTWFGGTQSSAFGGQFSLTQPFTLQGTVGTLTSVTVTLSNAQGTSAPATANF